MNINKVLQILEEKAPIILSNEFCLKYGAYDNSGIIVGLDKEVTGVLFSLDLTNNAIETAIKSKCNLIVTHHPAIYKGVDVLLESDAVFKAIKNGIGVISMHLNLDGAKNGIDYWFSKGLGAKKEEILMPLSCGGYGRTFSYNKTFKEFVDNYERVFESKKYLIYGDVEDKIESVSSFCGAGFGEEEYALSKNSSLIVSSDIPHHMILKVIESGRKVMVVTHYASEVYGFKKFYESVNIENKVFVTEEIYK